MVNLTVTLLVANNGVIVGRLDLRSDGDYEEMRSASWAGSTAEWAALLWTWQHAPGAFVNVTVKGEELLK